MPTLDLFSPATHPDGWRQVRAPGGYESWNFAVTSANGQMKVAAGVHLGHTDDVAYARRYRWYRRFPTRIKPPTPAEYPSVSLAVWEGGRLILSMLEAERRGEVRAAIDQGKVRIGGGRFETAADAALHLCVRGTTRRGVVTADLVFRPKPMAAPAESREGSQWLVMVAPTCEVAGEVSVFDANGSPRVLAIAGSGFHSH